jgi:putative effector of murein hydrolase LrgA (UPF0299 family)
MIHRVIAWTILILAILVVPYTHGILEYGGLILAAILLIALNEAIARRKLRGGAK